MDIEKEFISVAVDKKIAKKFKELVKSNGYTQKYVVTQLILKTIKDLENKELNQMGGLFNAEKRD